MDKTPEYYKAKLKEVDVSDGVNKEEAIIIAQNHLLEHGLEKKCSLSRPRIGDSAFKVEASVSAEVRLAGSMPAR